MSACKLLALALPRSVHFRFATSGLNLIYDGASYVTPFTVDAVVDSQHSISALDNQSNYTFGSWSDSRAATPTSPSAPRHRTITAIYTSTPVLTVDFVSDKTSGPASLKVQFTDKSTNATDWSWNFGDGTTPVLNRTLRTLYATTGIYTVTLTAGSNIAGYKIVSKKDYITVTSSVANFSVNPTSGTTATVFNFSDNSTGAVTSWSWNFQHSTDPSASFTRADQNPMVTFSRRASIPSLSP